MTNADIWVLGEGGGPQVHPLERVFGMLADLFEIGQVAGVGQAIKVD